MNEANETPGAPSPRLDPEPIPPPSPAEDKYAVLRIRDFQLYVSGRFIAAFGQQMLSTAVGWELYHRTHSTMVLGYVGLSYIIPLLFLTLPAGHVADQYDRRKIILGMEALIAVGSLGLTFVSWFHASYWWTYLFLAFGAVARAFLWPASSAFLPQIVPRQHLAAAVNWNSASFQISAALGPPAGGLVIAYFGAAAPVYAFNVVAALACVALLFFVRTRPNAPVKPQRMSISNLGAGLRFVLDTPIILATITLDLFAVLFGGVSAMLPVYAQDILQVNSFWLGVLQAGLPVGSACMAFVLAYLPPMRKAGRTLLFAVAGFGLATIVFGLSRNFWLSLAMMFACGAMDNISVVVRQTLVQILTPDELRGRVSAINMLFIGTSNEFGDFESGFVAHWLGPVITVVGGGIATILVVLGTGAIWPSLRDFGRLDGSDNPPPPAEPAKLAEAVR